MPWNGQGFARSNTTPCCVSCSPTSSSLPAAGQFDLVYDAGLYHAIRQVRLDPYLDALWRVTKPGSYYFCLAGAAEDTAEEAEEEGPPRVTADDIHHELGRLFESIDLRPIQLEGLSRRVAGWSCLMCRPVTGRA